MLACSSGHYQPASFVFKDFENNTGWSSAGIAFIVGLINRAWSFSCLDCATHMAEEIVEPERWIPVSILSTVAIGFATSFCYAISMFFCIKNLDAILSSTTGVPILDIFYQALGNKHGALCLASGVLLLVVFTWGSQRRTMPWLLAVSHSCCCHIPLQFVSCTREETTSSTVLSGWVSLVFSPTL